MRTSRKCTRCKKTKSLTRFSKASKERLGIAARCKVCVSEVYYIDRDRRTAVMRAWYRKNRERQLARHRKYYKIHKSTILENVRKWQEDNQDLVREYRRKSRKLHPQTSREVYTRRRSRLLGTKYVKLDPGAWEFVCGMWGDRCAYCGGSKRLTQDHVIPLSKGGWHDLDNLVPACGSCNSKKGSALILEVDWRL